jgi:hypothetical protein
MEHKSRHRFGLHLHADEAEAMHVGLGERCFRRGVAAQLRVLDTDAFRHLNLRIQRFNLHRLTPDSDALSPCCAETPPCELRRKLKF